MSAHKAAISSLWLLAAPDDEAMFTGIIDTLASHYGTPRFHPHLTIAGDIARAPEDMLKITANIAARVTPFSANVTGIGTSALYFRSFYAAFPLANQLVELRNAAGEMLTTDFGDFMPHISLLYGPVDEVAKQDSARMWNAALAGRSISFNRLAITTSANDVPVADWRIHAALHLG